MGLERYFLKSFWYKEKKMKVNNLKALEYRRTGKKPLWFCADMIESALSAQHDVDYKNINNWELSLSFIGCSKFCLGSSSFRWIKNFVVRICCQNSKCYLKGQAQRVL